MCIPKMYMVDNISNWHQLIVGHFLVFILLVRWSIFYITTELAREFLTIIDKSPRHIKKRITESLKATVQQVCPVVPHNMYICTIAASKIKGTAREIYRIFPCNGDFPCMYTGVYTGKIPASKATKSHMTWLMRGIPSRKKKRKE